MTSVRTEDNGDQGDDVTSIDSDGHNKLNTYSYRAVYSTLRMGGTLNDRDWEEEEEEEGVWILLTDNDEATAAGSNLASSTGGLKVLE